jgi:hypothetical protein
MRRVPTVVCCVAAALALGACGTPGAPTPAPKAATPVTPATTTAAVLDPKGTLDTARAAAGAASAGVVARQAAVPGQPATAPSIASPAEVASAAATALNGSATPPYEAKGRRDPFEPLDIKVGSERSTVSAAKLTGIVQGSSGPTALVETSDGIGYILKPGDTLADGRVTEIGNNLVVFSLAPKPGGQSNRVVLKLATD